MPNSHVKMSWRLVKVPIFNEQSGVKQVVEGNVKLRAFICLTNSLLNFNIPKSKYLRSSASPMSFFSKPRKQQLSACERLMSSQNPTSKWEQSRERSRERTNVPMNSKRTHPTHFKSLQYRHHIQATA